MRGKPADRPGWGLPEDQVGRRMRFSEAHPEIAFKFMRDIGQWEATYPASQGGTQKVCFTELRHVLDELEKRLRETRPPQPGKITRIADRKKDMHEGRYRARNAKGQSRIMKISVKAQQDELRDQMLAAGTGLDMIAADFARHYGMRPRTAWRRAHGWVLTRAADHISSEACAAGLHPGGHTVPMTGTRLCEYEAWPGPGRRLVGLKPTPHILALLARTYGTAIPYLLDTHDYKGLPPRDLLVIEAMQSDPIAAYSRASYPDELTPRIKAD